MTTFIANAQKCHPESLKRQEKCKRDNVATPRWNKSRARKRRWVNYVLFWVV